MEYSFCRELGAGFLLVVPSKDPKRGYVPLDVVSVDSQAKAIRCAVDRALVEQLLPDKNFIESGKRLVHILRTCSLVEHRQGELALPGESLVLQGKEVGLLEVISQYSAALIKVQQRSLEVEEEIKMTQPIIKTALGLGADLSEAKKQEIAEKRKKTSILSSTVRASKVIKKGLN